MNTYEITCQKCQGQAVIEVDDTQKLIKRWVKVVPIISARYRLDYQWGFQCTCGNDTRLSPQENRVIKDKVAPNPKDIAKVTANLEVDENNQFIMEVV